MSEFKGSIPREWQIEKNSASGHKHIFGPDTIGVVGQLTRVRVVEKEAFEAMRRERDQLQWKLMNRSEQLDETIAEARAEVERLKANQLGSFDVAVPSDKWYDTEKLLTECAAALEANVSALSGMILYRGEHVKQLDGTVKWELVPTYIKGHLDASQAFLTKLKSHMAGGGE